MCGIAALISSPRSSEDHLIKKMCDVVRHRGPDGEGYALFSSNADFENDQNNRWINSQYVYRGPLYLPSANASGAGRGDLQVALGHRRLAIVDIGEGGHQPLSYDSERYWVTFNGEIYNHIELSAELTALGHQFKSRSDTEVLLAAFAQWGTSSLQRFNGMFAFVLFDRLTQRLFAARDRYGVKPLYWWRSPDGQLAFGSEIKQFSVLPGWKARGDASRIYDYLVWGLTDHTDCTMYDGVRQVAPGHFIDIDVGDAKSGHEISASRWFTLDSESSELSFGEACEKFQELFFRSIELRLRADVAVGTALSGGLDSSSIVCAVDQLGREHTPSSEVSTFSARAHENAYDEGRYIDAVLKKARCKPHMIWPTTAGLISDLEKVVWHHDEPFGSTSIYAEWCVFRAVGSTSIKVTLDGHGADEILAGYTAYLGPHLGALARRGDLAGLMREVSCQRKLHGRSFSYMLASLIDDVAPEMIRNKLRQLAGRTSGDGGSWINLESLGARGADPFSAFGARGGGVLGLSLAQLKATSLPMQLKWTDRNSMAHGVESREPFLDPALVSFVLSLPPSYKLEDGVTKRILRQALRNVLPPEVAGRRDKMGFVTPEEVWLRLDRPDWTRSALGEAVDMSRGVLTPHALRLGGDMIEGRVPFHNRLWRMICFGAWMKACNIEGLSG